MRLIACVLILCLSLTGCVAESEKLDPQSKEEPAEITLTPVDLFKGDGAKFKHFLGAMSGSFRLRYEGKKPNANLDIDIWQNGKKVASSGSIGDLFYSSDDRARQEIEIIISIDTDYSESQDNFMKIKVGSIDDSGSSLSTFTIPWDKKFTTLGSISNNEPRKFSTDESVHVWGMQATSTNSMITADLSPESLSRLERAIIFMLRFKD